MQIRAVLIVAALLVPMSCVLADDIRPGRWELTLETRVDAAPDFMPDPMSVTQCLTQADARDPAKLLGSMATPEAHDCSITDRSYVGDRFRFKLQCGGASPMSASGDITLAPNGLDGVITSSGTIDGVQVEMRSTMHGRRIGDC